MNDKMDKNNLSKFSKSNEIHGSTDDNNVIKITFNVIQNSL